MEEEVEHESIFQQSVSRGPQSTPAPLKPRPRVSGDAVVDLVLDQDQQEDATTRTVRRFQQSASAGSENADEEGLANLEENVGAGEMDQGQSETR